MSPPPKIMFDDGSRIMQDASDTAAEPSSTTSTSARGNVPLGIYYEIDRVAKEVVDKLDWSMNTARGRLLKLLLEGDASKNNDTADGKSETAVAAATKVNDTPKEDDGFLCRVALQFPDELLSDAPDVSWLMEEAITHAYSEKLLSSGQNLQSDMEQLSQHHLKHKAPLLFVLGDTTYGSCCPDEVSANHLNANVIVHYGYACLSPTESVPVVYAFGAVSNVVDESADESNNDVWKECVQSVSEETLKRNGENLEDAMDQLSMEKSMKKKLLILYEVKYHHAMDDLKLEFEKTGKFQVVLGMIPKQQLSINRLKVMNIEGGCSGGDCSKGNCSSDANQDAAPVSNACRASEGADCSAEIVQTMDQSCCKQDDASCGVGSGDDTTCNTKTNEQGDTNIQQSVVKQYIPRTIGGLEIPDDLDLSQHTLLYIGDDLNIDSYEGNARTRLLHILLRCGAPDGPSSIWSYSPANRSLNTDVLNAPLSPTNSTPISSVLSRMLRRRYFLLNKAKLATTIAILIGTTSNSYSFRRLLHRTRHRIQSTGRTAYTFAVGKLSTSAHKLSNFAEIDCFVLIACGESITKFWQMEREEMLVPVLTPLELDVALGFREWDGRYSCDFGDLIRWDEADGVTLDGDGDESDDCNQQSSMKQSAKNTDEDGGNDGSSDDDDDDEPFFSMISGKYEQSRTITKQKSDLEALPGQGKLIEYRSEAAEFLKQREYKGLKANVGETEAKAAVLGQVGIASNYGEKLEK